MSPGTAEAQSSRNFTKNKASTKESTFRATASSYLVCEKAPVNTQIKVDATAKPSINTTGLIHDEGIKYKGTFDSITKGKNRITLYKARI